MSTIWRDDDILLNGKDLDKLLRVDDILKRRGAVHTIAIIASTLTPELGTIISERGMSAQLHCWAHDDLSVDEAAIAQLPMALAKVEDMTGQRPTVLYPPWNRTGPALERAAAGLGLTVSAKKHSLGQYIRGARGLPVNFHFWHQPDEDLLETALTR